MDTIKVQIHELINQVNSSMKHEEQYGRKSGLVWRDLDHVNRILYETIKISNDPEHYKVNSTGYCFCGGQRWREAGTGKYRGIGSYRCDKCSIVFAGCGSKTHEAAIRSKELADNNPYLKSKNWSEETK